jgi:NitT/TauT family transport system ATP-binding protein
MVMAATAPADVGVEIEHVTHVFQGAAGAGQEGLTVLRDISVSVPPHTFVSILGPSGCGKTTLLRIIDGLITPTEGQVRIDGLVIRGPGRDRAMVFQDADLLPWRTALDNVSFGQEVQGVGKHERVERAHATMTRVGLQGFENHYPFQLSGGMRQRVGLARALSTDPRVLLMDEPFGALDAQTREEMQGALLRLWEQDKITVVFITHSVDEAVLLSDYVVVLSFRPGSVREVLKIDLPRPRAGEEDLRSDPLFAEYRRAITHLLRSSRQAALEAGRD